MWISALMSIPFATLRARPAVMAVLLTCVGLLPSCALAPPAEVDATKTMRTNGYGMTYIERGIGAPVVLVHGSLVDYRYWVEQMGPLAARYRVIAPSLRHYYPERWDGKGEDFSIEQHAKDVASFIRGLNAGRVHLMAHSRGGNVAMHVAKWHPELLRSLVLADASGLEGLLSKTPTAENSAASGSAVRKKVREHLLAGDIDRGLTEFIDFAVGPGTWAASTEERRQGWRDNALTIIADVDRPQTTCAEAAKFTMPVLLINGEASPPRYRQMFDAFQRCVKLSERVLIPKASHTMFRTHPDAINAEILTFLDRN